MTNKHNITTQSDLSEVSGVMINKAIEKFKKDSTEQTQNEMNEADRRQWIATAAYYRAERRGFNSGYEIQDWLEAEADIDGALQNQRDADY